MGSIDTGTGQTLFLTSEDVERSFSWDAAVDALRRLYSSVVTKEMFPPRTMARGDGLWLRTLSGILPDGGLMGAKLIAANLKRRRASYLIPLFDQTSVELVALLDGNSITGFRTAATTAMAIDTLAPKGSIHVGVLGTGFEARNHVRALASIREIASIKVFSPNPDSRAAFVRDLADLDCSIDPVESARTVVESGGDVLLCTARSRDETPLFEGGWLSPGVTVASIGSTLPEQREVDPDTVARASFVVADMPDEVAHDTGDMRAARAAGVRFEDKLVALADLINGRHPGRTSDSDIILYKSVGAAIQDMAVAALCLQRARELGLGCRLGQTIRPISK